MSALIDHRAGTGGGEPPAGDPAPAGAAPTAEVPAESGGTRVVQDAPGPSPAQLRVDFGAHLEANYQRLVAQLYAITLDPVEAHDSVQDAYSRAWRNWSVVGRSPDPGAWVRRVAVRSTVHSWRRALARIGAGRRRPAGDGADPRTGALLSALGRLSPGERRAVVLFHMAGVPLGEIAAMERISPSTVQVRLARSRHVVTEGMAEVLPQVPGLTIDDTHPGHVGDGHDGRGLW